MFRPGREDTSGPVEILADTPMEELNLTFPHTLDGGESPACETFRRVCREAISQSDLFWLAGVGYTRHAAPETTVELGFVTVDDSCHGGGGVGGDFYHTVYTHPETEINLSDHLPEMVKVWRQALPAAPEAADRVDLDTDYLQTVLDEEPHLPRLGGVDSARSTVEELFVESKNPFYLVLILRGYSPPYIPIQTTAPSDGSVVESGIRAVAHDEYTLVEWGDPEREELHRTLGVLEGLLFQFAVATAASRCDQSLERLYVDVTAEHHHLR